MQWIHRLVSYTASQLPASMAGTKTAVASLIIAVLAAGVPASGLAQGLVLTASVGKTEFFEDEPIYLLVQLHNVGTDTAWVTMFGLVSPAVVLSVHRADGKPVPLGKPALDYAVPPGWRGEPVPPGASQLNAQVLQELIGEERDSRSHLFPKRLVPGLYELRVEFHAHNGVSRAVPLVVSTAPIVFGVRERTLAEDDEVGELEAMRAMGYDTTRVAGVPRAAGYKTALISWVGRRLREQPDDPFLSFMLSDGLYGVGQILWRYIQAGEVQRFDPDTSEVVSRLRLAVIERHALPTAAAHLVQALSARHPDQLALLVERLRATPAGEMARYQVERNQHGQQAKTQSPH